MSRHATQQDTSQANTSNPAQEYVDCLLENASPKSVTLAEIHAETLKDETLQTVAKLSCPGQWHTIKDDAEMLPYSNPMPEWRMNSYSLITPTSSCETIGSPYHSPSSRE